MAVPISNNYRKFRIYHKRYLKFDFVAGIVVCLVAIHLCLGISIASGTPFLSGIISGIVGGIVVGICSGSQVSVSGPAAGMATIVVAAIADLGGFPTFLMALLVAGMLQIAIGFLKAGFIAEYVPSNVVQGLLCAIGILLIVKQMPLAFTLSNDFSELKLHLLETTEGFTVLPLFKLIYHLNAGAIILTFMSFVVLIYFNQTRQPILKEIPAPIVVVLLGIMVNEIFAFSHFSLVQNSDQLVNIPTITMVQQLDYHNWSAWGNPKVYLYGLIIAVVASLETVLNVKAAEKLDTKRRSYSKNRELIAQGIGNMVAGFLGGLPITSVIVRTSVNIQAGAKTKLASILHGCFILFAVMLMPNAINKIPLCSLAAILIYTGYKLTNPQIYRKIYAQGLDRFIPFIVTVFVIITWDLLTGILVGLLISLFYILKSNSAARFDIIQEHHPHGIINRLILPQQISFLNKASLITELESIPVDSQLIIDARYSTYIDKEIAELIKEFKEERAPLKSIALNLLGFKDKYDIHDYTAFINVTTYDAQAALTPAQVLNILREGNQRFMQDMRIHRATKLDIEQTSKNQHPIAVILGCIDSRVPVETIFDMTFGDLFIIRIAGNVVNDDILASIEYACHVIGVKLIVVLGHTSCGAIAAACDGVTEGHVTQLLEKIQPAINAEKNINDNRTSTNLRFVQKVTEFNVANALRQIYQQSEILQQMLQREEMGFVGAIYNVAGGEVHFRNFASSLALLDGEKIDHKFSLHLRDLMHSKE